MGKVFGCVRLGENVVKGLAKNRWFGYAVLFCLGKANEFINLYFRNFQ